MPNNPLPSTGNTISFNDIRIELGVGSASPFDIAGAAADDFSQIQHCAGPWPDSGSAQGTNPDSISEWWSYNHSIRATVFVTGDDSTISCDVACAGTAPYNCFDTVYNYGSGYYVNDTCRNTFTGYIVQPTNCSSGTKTDQTCYYISNGALISETPCPAPCNANGTPCIDSSTCCGGCCNGYCADQAC